MAKLNAAGSGLEYSTLLGGAGRDEVYALALGSNEVAYATGLTDSNSFPTTAGAYLRAKPGSAYAGYVTALNPAGTAAEYSTFLGPVDDYYTTAFGIAADPSGSAVVTGTTSSASFPVTSNVFQPHPGGAADAFVLGVSAGGASLSFSTYLGGSSADHGRAVALDASGNVYVVGSSDSANLPTTPAAFQPAAGPAGESFVAKIDGSSVSCSYTLSATSATLPPGGGQGSVGVTTGTGCAWTARSEVSWLTVQSGASGIGSGVVDFSAEANSSTSSRTGKLIIGGNYFTVTQTGTSCSYSLDPASASYGPAGGAGSTALNAPSGCAWSAMADVSWIVLTGGASGSGPAAIPYEVRENTGPPRSGSIRANGAVTTVNQSGYTGRIGVFQDGSWTIDSNGDWTWDQGVNDKSFGLGWPGTKPVIGDWNGDGHDKAGVFSDGWWYLDYDGNGVWDGGIADRVCALGSTGMQPVVGDWNGDGKDEIGIYNGGYWYLDWNGNCVWDGGAYDRQITLGWSSATPVVGDWNGDGRSKVGVWGDGWWYLDVDGNGLWDWGVADRLVALGWAGVQPKVADWNGDGKDDIAIYDGGFWYQDLNGNGVWDGTPPDRLATLGWQGTVPVIGDWNGDGRADIGVFASGWWYLDYNGNGVWDGSGIDKLVAWGVAGNTPVAGRW
jgi:hypothetical protein